MIREGGLPKHCEGIKFLREREGQLMLDLANEVSIHIFDLCILGTAS